MKNIFDFKEVIISEEEKQSLKKKYYGKYKIVFMGTPDFAVGVLENIDEIFGVSAVVTVPDKPQGRGLVLTPSAVKSKALEREISILQPESLKDDKFISELESLKPDIFCVVAFRILPERVFNIPTLGSFNIHGSLLPKFRGAAPINRAIMDGETETGLTSFLLNNVVDTGNILLKTKVEITNELIASELYDALKPKASDLALKTIELLINNNYTAIQQDDTLATKAPKLYPNESFIDWDKSSNEIRCFVHGLAYHPGARNFLNGKLFKIFRVRVSEELSQESLTDKFTTLQNGEILIENNQLFVKCENGLVELIEVQLEGKKMMSGKDFALGMKSQINGKILSQIKE